METIFIFSFASFIEGDSHVQDDEIMEYETSQYGLGYISTDDDSNDSDDDHLDGQPNIHVPQSQISHRRPPSVAERHSISRTSTPTNSKTNGYHSHTNHQRGYKNLIEVSEDDE